MPAYELAVDASDAREQRQCHNTEGGGATTPAHLVDLHNPERRVRQTAKKRLCVVNLPRDDLSPAAQHLVNDGVGTHSAGKHRRLLCDGA